MLLHSYVLFDFSDHLMLFEHVFIVSHCFFPIISFCVWYLNKVLCLLSWKCFCYLHGSFRFNIISFMYKTIKIKSVKVHSKSHRVKNLSGFHFYNLIAHLYPMSLILVFVWMEYHFFLLILRFLHIVGDIMPFTTNISMW